MIGSSDANFSRNINMDTILPALQEQVKPVDPAIEIVEKMEILPSTTTLSPYTSGGSTEQDHSTILARLSDLETKIMSRFDKLEMTLSNRPVSSSGGSRRRRTKKTSRRKVRK